MKITSGGGAGFSPTDLDLTGPIAATDGVTSITSQTGTGTTFVTSVSPQITGNTTTIEGLKIGLGGGAVTTNTVLGISALASNTTGLANMALGTSALTANTDGLANSAGGFRCLWKNTSGSSNTGYGYGTLNEAVSASSNTAFGATALNVATGSNNTGIGAAALANCTSGTNNATLGLNSGSDALLNITTQSNQVVVGNNSTTTATIKVAWTVVSDEREKQIEGPVPHGLSFVNQLSPIAFRLKRDTAKPEEDKFLGAKLRYGFSAQAILALEGDSPVIIDATDPDRLKYTESNMVAILVNALKEVSLELKEVSARLDALEAAGGS